MIRLSVTNTLQNDSNTYVFSSQDDLTAAIHLLFDSTGYGEKHLKSGSLQLKVVSDEPLDTTKPFYEF